MLGHSLVSVPELCNYDCHILNLLGNWSQTLPNRKNAAEVRVKEKPSAPARKRSSTIGQEMIKKSDNIDNTKPKLERSDTLKATEHNSAVTTPEPEKSRKSSDPTASKRKIKRYFTRANSLDFSSIEKLRKKTLTKAPSLEKLFEHGSKKPEYKSSYSSPHQGRTADDKQPSYLQSTSLELPREPKSPTHKVNKALSHWRQITSAKLMELKPAEAVASSLHLKSGAPEHQGKVVSRQTSHMVCVICGFMKQACLQFNSSFHYKSKCSQSGIAKQ